MNYSSKNVLNQTVLSKALFSIFLGFGVVQASAQTSQSNDNDVPSTTLDTIYLTANQLYYVDPSEDNDYYSANVATVGTKIPASLENIPQSVSVITQKKMDDLNVETLDKLAKRTAGLRVLQNDDGRSSIYARGYEYDQFSVDGLPAPMASINGTLPNLVAFDRVEVLKGASGLFNSSSEMGGVVNLVRKRGKADGKNTLQASVFDPKGFDITADMQGALSNDDSVTGRAIVQHKQQISDVVDNAGGDENTNTTFYSSLDKKFGENDDRIGIGYLYQKRNITPNNGLPTAQGLTLLGLPNDDFYGAKWNDFNSESHDVFVDGLYQLPSKGIVSAGIRYSDRKTDYNYAFAGSALDNNRRFTATGLGAVIKEDALSADINLSQPFLTKGGQSEFVVGADYKDFNRHTKQARFAHRERMTVQDLNNLTHTDYINSPQSRITDENNTLKETALYAKLGYKVSKPLTVIVGGRLNHYDITSRTVKNITSTSNATKDDNKAIGYGAVVYEFNPNVNGYFSYTEVFKPQYATNRQNEILDPRKGEQYEIGVKGFWQGNQHLSDITGLASIYRLNDENAAATTVNNDTVALGERQMQGFELEANGTVGKHIQLSAGYAYLDSTIKQKGNEDGIFLLMPKHTANLWGTYTYQLQRPLTIGLGVNYVGEFESSQGVKADNYSTWDAMISYPFTDKLKGQLNLYNLFDEDYYARVGGANTFNIPGDGREVKASLTYEF